MTFEIEGKVCKRNEMIKYIDFLCQPCSNFQNMSTILQIMKYFLFNMFKVDRTFGLIRNPLAKYIKS